MARSGQITVTTAGTAVQGSDVPGHLFSLKAHDAATGIIYVGDDGSNDVSATTGYPLEAGESVELELANLNQLWFDASVSGEKACWLKLN